MLRLYPWGGAHVTWCRTNAGAEKSAANMPYKARVIGVSELIKWHDSGIDELEAMFKL